jgi:hypothetical protein
MAGGLGPVRQYQLTLDGSAQQLTDAITGNESGDSWNGDPLCEIDLQADDGNSNPIFVGGDAGVTAASHGVRIPAPASGVPSPPYRLPGKRNPSSVWVIGTSAEKLNVLLNIV